MDSNQPKLLERKHKEVSKKKLLGLTTVVKQQGQTGTQERKHTAYNPTQLEERERDDPSEENFLPDH